MSCCWRNAPSSFERLPCVEDADLLRNILYSGVWLKYNCKTAKDARKRGSLERFCLDFCTAIR